MKENDSDDQNPAAQKAGEYIRELLAEKLSIDVCKNPNAARLIDQEVARVQNIGKVPNRDLKYVDIYREKPMKVSVKVLVPVREHPKFNFVGKLLGPKGNSMKRLQEDTMCKMAVLGRGSMKDRQKEEELRQSLDPKYAHLTDDLHVEISALGPPAEAHARIAFALAEVRKYLIPDNNDNIRQEQMREMEIISAADPSIKEVPPPPGTKRSGGILRDRARIAMEESYGGGYEEPYEPNEPSYEPYPAPVSHSRSTYSSHHYDTPEYEPEYYRESSASYAEPSSHRWKPYKTSSSSSRHSESTRYRSSPYTRPAK